MCKDSLVPARRSRESHEVPERGREGAGLEKGEEGALRAGKSFLCAQVCESKSEKESKAREGDNFAAKYR